MSFKKVSFVVIAVIIAAIVFRLATSNSQEEGSGVHSARGRGHMGMQQTPTVPVENVVYRSFRNKVVFTGNIIPMYDMAIVARATGRIEKIYKHPGQRVRANGLIARLENTEQQNSVNEAEANLAFAKAQLAEAQNNYEIAQRELEQSKTLFEKEFISQAQLDAANSKYLSRVSALGLAKAQLSQREAALKTARLRLSYTRLTAPNSGVVGNMNFDRGSIISQGAQLTSVVSIDSVRCEINIPERLISHIKNGMEAVVVKGSAEGRKPDREYRATVLSVSPIIDRQSRTAAVEVLIKNSDHSLKPGMFARVYLVMGKRDSVPGVPQRAIAEYNAQMGVFGVADDNTVQFISVETGFSEDGFVEIMGEKIPQRVVTDGLFMLSDGAKIQVAGQTENTHERKGKNPTSGKMQRQ